MTDSNHPLTTPSLVFHGRRKVELAQHPFADAALAPNEVEGTTLVTLASPGTEVNWAFDAEQAKPLLAGYACVFEIQRVGSEVTSLRPGDRVFAMAPHRARQRKLAADTVLLPAGVAPEVAVFARLVGVSWTTLTTTQARPADRVLVYGLGIIGNMAAQLFAAAGYRVTGIDLDLRRCELARSVGLEDARISLAADDQQVRGRAALAIDCTGHEQAVVDACQAVKKGGEVVLVGVPWKQRCQATAFSITHAVFHRYVTLRSGWEWSLPHHEQNFARGHLFANFASAVDWLAQGRLRTQGLAVKVSPTQAQTIYDQLLSLQLPTLTAVFDWTLV